MRGALEPLPGIGDVQITKGEPKFSVAYDSAEIDVDKILAVLEEAKHPAKKL